MVAITNSSNGRKAKSATPKNFTAGSEKMTKGTSKAVTIKKRLRKSAAAPGLAIMLA